MKKVIEYFKELLDTLKKIEKHLRLISRCVKEDHHDYGDRSSISTKHWND